MTFQEKTLTCSDCTKSFTFSAEEQEQFQSRGYTNEPKRCPECRQARKAEQNRTGSNGSGNGGYGYSMEFNAQRFWRDARVLSIFEGTSEIQLEVIGRRIMEQ